jgi:DtxR family Mn-dependent transcriptional regulator
MEDVGTRSQIVEDYLKAIFSLAERDGAHGGQHGGQHGGPAGGAIEHEPVTTSRVAERLGLSASSVSGMLRRLAAQGLVDHRPYGGVTLTDTGLATALQVVRRHRLVEMFLVAQLGYSWDEVHEEAELLEHTMTDRLVQRIDAALGSPRFDPHGDPIPGPDGELPWVDAHRLSGLNPGDTGHLARVDDQDPAVLRHLTDVGISLGESIRLIERLPFDGPYVISTDDGRTHQLGPALANALWIA